MAPASHLSASPCLPPPATTLSPVSIRGSFREDASLGLPLGFMEGLPLGLPLGLPRDDAAGDLDLDLCSATSLPRVVMVVALFPTLGSP